MRTITLAKSLVCLFAAVAFQIVASAHTGLKESTPAAGATVTAEPSEISLVFSGEVKLIKLELMGMGHEMPTSFEPSTEAKASYVFQTPGMHAGKFTVNWAAIGEDGHTLTNSFEFEVDPTASASSSAH